MPLLTPSSEKSIGAWIGLPRAGQPDRDALSSPGRKALRARKRRNFSNVDLERAPRLRCMSLDSATRNAETTLATCRAA
jgi:hypothetical protein